MVWIYIPPMTDKTEVCFRGCVCTVDVCVLLSVIVCAVCRTRSQQHFIFFDITHSQCVMCNVHKHNRRPIVKRIEPNRPRIINISSNKQKMKFVNNVRRQHQCNNQQPQYLHRRCCQRQQSTTSMQQSTTTTVSKIGDDNNGHRVHFGIHCHRYNRLSCASLVVFVVRRVFCDRIDRMSRTNRKKTMRNKKTANREVFFRHAVFFCPRYGQIMCIGQYWYTLYSTSTANSSFLISSFLL